MNRNHILLSLCLFVLLAAFPAAALSADTIKWYSYDEGMALGKSQQKKVFINFYADWCGYCAKMDKETFTDPLVVSFLNKNFIPIKVNSDRENAVSARYKIRGLPSTWFFSENGEQIGSQPGYLPADNLLPILKFIQTNSYKEMAFKDFLKNKDQ